MATESDEAIVRRVLDGDVDAFERLVERHQAHVARIVARHVEPYAVAEVAHEAFVSAYLSLARWAPTHPFAHWLARIALRACADHWRAAERAGRLPVASAEEAEGAASPAAAGGPGATGAASDDREVLERALARLSPEDRRVLVLMHFEELSVRECARLLGWSAARVKVRAHRARARLREYLGGAWGGAWGGARGAEPGSGEVRA